MKKRIEFDYNEDTGLTIAKLYTSKGLFFGMAVKHPDDKFKPSYSVGMKIAEARAYINMYNALIRDKKLELKGIKRLLAAMPEEATNRNYATNLEKTIENEILELKTQKRNRQTSIKIAIESRNIYIRSRSINREEREKVLAGLGEAIGALGKLQEQVNSAKEKE